MLAFGDRKYISRIEKLISHKKYAINLTLITNGSNIRRAK